MNILLFKGFVYHKSDKTAVCMLRMSREYAGSTSDRLISANKVWVFAQRAIFLACALKINGSEMIPLA